MKSQQKRPGRQRAPVVTHDLSGSLRSAKFCTLLVRGPKLLMVDSRISRPWCRPTALPDPMVRSSNAKIIGRATFHRWVLTGLDRAETEIRTMRFGRDDIRRTVHFYESRTLKPGFCSAIRPKSLKHLISISGQSAGKI